MYEAVKNRILQLCEQNGYTIFQLAIESGVAQSTIKNILYGKSRNPGIVTLKLLCDGFGITITDFFDTPIFRQMTQEFQ